MTHVWIVEGWFGDLEWIEAVYATEEAGDARVRELMVDRRSLVLAENHWAQGHCKFAAVEHEVLQ